MPCDVATYAADVGGSACLTCSEALGADRFQAAYGPKSPKECSRPNDKFLPCQRTPERCMLGTEISERRGGNKCPIGFHCPGNVDTASSAIYAQPFALPGNIEDSTIVVAALRCRNRTARPEEGVSCRTHFEDLFGDMCERRM